MLKPVEPHEIVLLGHQHRFLLWNAETVKMIPDLTSMVGEYGVFDGHG